jgi:predicted nucleotidyltransferase component of viral defense system
VIPEAFIEQWRNNAKWQTLAQVEQDLVLSRALVDLYSDHRISETLLFRGGTALNKLFIRPPSRYSEDIDFTQKIAGPIGGTIDAVREILKPWLGDPKWKITQRGAKLLYRYQAINGLQAKLKVEINTTEHFHALPLLTKELSLISSWYTAKAQISTYEIDELMATKLRALYQRRKGRDLFDLWYVVTHNLVDINRMLEIFSAYCSYNNTTISKKDFINNLELKKYNRDFKEDMSILLPERVSWNFEDAFQCLLNNVINRLP